ncbi:aquaporin-like protein [Xylariales sp. PMI_506]|nr:aquaporin-like protein [Xylariales sp. PMI_506]
MSRRVSKDELAESAAARIQTNSPVENGHQDTTDDGDEGLSVYKLNTRSMDFPGSFVKKVSPPSPVLRKPWYLRSSYYLDGWLDSEIWKAAIVEGVGTFCLTYLSGQGAVSIMNYGTPQVGGYIAVFISVLLAAHIFATAPASGGHVNPLITYCTILCGLCPVARGILYMIFQTLGASLAGGFLLASWGHDKAVKYNGGGCFIDTSTITIEQAFTTELVSCFIIVFLSFGVGLDPRQRQLFGPALTPILVGLCLGLVSFVTSDTASGYSGAGMNPARCFGLSVSTGNFSRQWIWWSAAAVSGIVQAILYNLNPPNGKEKA